MLIVAFEFLVLAVVVALAGTYLARSANQIAEITGLGRLLIGSVLLAAATSLPELSVDLSAVRQGIPDLAAGDLFGSSLMNLLILAVLDLAHRSEGKMLSREAAAHALSAVLSIALAAIAGMAILTESILPGVTFLGIGTWTWGILVAYLLGVRLIFFNQRVSAHAVANAAAVAASEPNASDNQPVLPPLWQPVAFFAAAAFVLVFAGPRLAHTAGQLADLSGLGKTFVGTTFVALCTSLPELVASITALRMKAFDLVVGNVFGSNAFNMILFLPLDAAHPGVFFADISPSHAVTSLAVILATAVAALGQLYNVEKRQRLVEPDSLLMLLILGGAIVLVYRLSS
jgi:cation:H+ antiporter